eukprot:6291952-Prymnesium_polylepis.1
MARASPKSGRNGRTHLLRSNIFGIWLPKRLLSALHGRIGPHDVRHNIMCVRGARWVKSDANFFGWAFGPP